MVMPPPRDASGNDPQDRTVCEGAMPEEGTAASARRPDLSNSWWARCRTPRSLASPSVKRGEGRADFKEQS